MPDHVAPTTANLKDYFEIPFLTIAEDTVKLGKDVVLRQFCNLYDCTIGEGTKIGSYTEIGGATVGKNCIIGAGVFIPPGILIEDDVFIGPHVVFTNDRWPRAKGEWTKRYTFVKSGASVGANATILSGITIGAGAMVGAGSIIAHDIPPNAIAKSPQASHYCRHCHPLNEHR